MGVESDTTGLIVNDLAATGRSRIHVLRPSDLREKAGSTIPELTSTTEKEVNNTPENGSCIASPLSWADLTRCLPEAHKWGAPEHPEGTQSSSCALIWAGWVNNEWCRFQFMTTFIQSVAEGEGGRRRFKVSVLLLLKDFRPLSPNKVP